MPVVMKLHASLVVQLLPVPCHSRPSPTALLSDSCNSQTGKTATRSPSKTTASRATVKGGANTGGGNVSPVRTAHTTSAKNLLGTGSQRACKRHVTSEGAAMPPSATGLPPPATSTAALDVSDTPTPTTTRKRIMPRRRQAAPAATPDGAQLLQRYLQLGLTLLPVR